MSNNKTINQFPTDVVLTGTEYILGMSEGVTIKLVLDSIKNFILSGATSGSTGVQITGGTYDNSTGELSLVDSTGGTVTVSGFYTGGTFIETISDNGNGAVYVDNTDPANPIIGFTGVTTDGVTVTGTGLAGDPLTAVGGGGISYWSASTGTNAIVVNNSDSVASGTLSLAVGDRTLASGIYSNSEGQLTIASGEASHSEGQNTTAGGTASHAEGYLAKAIGEWSHAEGSVTRASGSSSHAEGSFTTAGGANSHAEGIQTTAIGQASHAEGSTTTAEGFASHAEGELTTAVGAGAHAEGYLTTASGQSAHAGGAGSTAGGNFSFIHSYESTVSGLRSAVLGGQNITGDKNDTVYVPTLALVTVRDYADDAAADADTTLASGGLYTITGSRAVYRKP